MLRVLVACAAISLAFTPAQAANLHDNDYSDDYAAYAAENEGLTVYEQYMDLMMKSKTAAYCWDNFQIESGNGTDHSYVGSPGTYWMEVAEAALDAAKIEYPEQSEMYNAHMKIWADPQNPFSYSAQFDADQTRVKFEECPNVKEPEFKGPVN